MLKADKAKKIISILNKIYPETPIPLNHKNNFELLIAIDSNNIIQYDNKIINKP